MKQYLIIVPFIITIFGCDPADDRLKIINNSDTDIYIYYSCDSLNQDFHIFRNGYYPIYENDSVYLLADEYIKKGSTTNIPHKGANAWENIIKNCANKHLHFFIYLDSVIMNYPEDEIKNKELYEKHFSYTLKELKQNNWTIVYD